jgi:GNAT superfamily N-acetyltransferase
MASAIAASSTVQAAEQGSLLSKDSKCPVEMFIIRPARLSDIPKLAIHCHKAYSHEPIFRFLWPLAQIYPSDSILIFRRWVMRSYLGPQSICLVACHASDRSTPIAHIQFDRLGNDAGAKKFARDRGLWEKIWLCILGWCFVAYSLLEDAIWPERIVDRERSVLHRRWCWADDLKYWDHSRERKNRWHVKNIVVVTQWQGKGVGKLLMREVMASPK